MWSICDNHCAVRDSCRSAICIQTFLWHCFISQRIELAFWNFPIVSNHNSTCILNLFDCRRWNVLNVWWAVVASDSCFEAARQSACNMRVFEFQNCLRNGCLLDQKEFLYYHNFECMADRYRTRNCGIRTVLFIISWDHPWTINSDENFELG